MTERMSRKHLRRKAASQRPAVSQIDEETYLQMFAEYEQDDEKDVVLPRKRKATPKRKAAQSYECPVLQTECEKEMEEPVQKKQTWSEDESISKMWDEEERIAEKKPRKWWKDDPIVKMWKKQSAQM